MIGPTVNETHFNFNFCDVLKLGRKFEGEVSPGRSLRERNLHASFQLVPAKLPFHCCSIRPVGKLTSYSVEKFSESLKNTSGPSIKFRSACFGVLLRNSGEETEARMEKDVKERERKGERRNSNNFRKY